MLTVETNDPVDLDFPARPEYLADVRKAVKRVAERTSLDHAAVDDLLTAADEAVANAIRHGSPRGEHSQVHVTCRWRPDSLTVEVQDQGTGFMAPKAPAMPGPEATGGRGLPLMCALSDTVQIESTPKGTRITLKKASRT
uniref:Histidine kinase/HSP90-like ATPase domain-containing protein n=1 Tax=uncultured Armatimonadetes bacterium TaxID=157466 RepID=A0A6J4JME6_9BACT|nr:hypothetical protein AVDCRST_MAG63-3672 [uncultured Armatimonadetes bacterium]